MSLNALIAVLALLAVIGMTVVLRELIQLARDLVATLRSPAEQRSRRTHSG